MGEYQGAEWLERHLSSARQTCELSPFARVVADLVGQTWRGIYHLPSGMIQRWQGDRVELFLHGELATFDSNELTELVILCHERCIRLAIRPAMVWQSSRDAGRDGVVREWNGMGFKQIGKNPSHYRMAVPALRLTFTPRSRGTAEDAMMRHPTIDEAVARARGIK